MDTINFVILVVHKLRSSRKYLISMVLPLELLITWLLNIIWIIKEGIQVLQQISGLWVLSYTKWFTRNCHSEL